MIGIKIAFYDLLIITKIWKPTYVIVLINRDDYGALAQLVEQWTENPCVPGSIPGGTTETFDSEFCWRFFYFE